MQKIFSVKYLKKTKPYKSFLSYKKSIKRKINKFALRIYLNDLKAQHIENIRNIVPKLSEITLKTRMYAQKLPYLFKHEALRISLAAVSLILVAMLTGPLTAENSVKSSILLANQSPLPLTVDEVGRLKSTSTNVSLNTNTKYSRSDLSSIATKSNLSQKTKKIVKNSVPTKKSNQKMRQVKNNSITASNRSHVRTFYRNKNTKVILAQKKDESKQEKKPKKIPSSANQIM